MTDTTWLVLRCASPKTLALVKALQDRGVHAWTPTWKRQIQFPRSNKKRIVSVPCIASFVFVPRVQEGPARYFMRSPHVVDFTILSTERGPIIVPDYQLGHLRKIADKPAPERPPLPMIGDRVRFSAGPWQGHNGTVVKMTKNDVFLEIDGFPLYDLQLSPFILSEITA